MRKWWKRSQQRDLDRQGYMSESVLWFDWTKSRPPPALNAWWHQNSLLFSFFLLPPSLQILWRPSMFTSKHRKPLAVCMVIDIRTGMVIVLDNSLWRRCLTFYLAFVENPSRISPQSVWPSKYSRWHLPLPHTTISHQRSKGNRVETGATAKNSPTEKFPWFPQVSQIHYACEQDKRAEQPSQAIHRQSPQGLELYLRLARDGVSFRRNSVSNPPSRRACMRRKVTARYTTQ